MSEEWNGDPMGFMDLSHSIEDDIAAGMKMFDIKPDYYVDDNYLFWAYDDESVDELEEQEARENECHTCGLDLRDEACNQWPRCQELID